jgi:hypothetical protein
MFVVLVECILSTVDHTGTMQAFLPQLSASCFLCRGTEFSQLEPATESISGEQDVCPGCDNGEVPIGCFVIEDTLVDMGVIHQ